MILITGASSGIGEACAREFASRGRSLLLLARRRERLELLAHELRQTHGVEVHAFALDLRDRQAVQSWAEAHPGLIHRIEVLINNAGLARGMSAVQEGSEADWDEMIDTNLRGVLLMLRLCLPALIARQGHVVQIGSVAARWVYPKGNVYCATKAAVHALSEAIRHDLMGTGVRVTEISPGMVETEFSEVRLGDAALAKAVYEGMTPLTGKDVAETVAWAVDRPRHVNIQEVVIYPTDQVAPGVLKRR